MQENKNIEERIQVYLDELCTEKEAAEIEKLIAVDPSWKEAYVSLSGIHQLLISDFEPLAPSMRFSKNVMEQIAGLSVAKPTRQYLNPIVVWAIGGILATMLVLIFGYAVSLEEWSTLKESSSVFKLPKISTPSIDWSSFLNSQTTMLLLLVNTVLGFALFDFWLRRKKAVI